MYLIYLSKVKRFFGVLKNFVSEKKIFSEKIMIKFFKEFFLYEDRFLEEDDKLIIIPISCDLFIYFLLK